MLHKTQEITVKRVIKRLTEADRGCDHKNSPEESKPRGIMNPRSCTSPNPRTSSLVCWSSLQNYRYEEDSVSTCGHSQCGMMASPGNSRSKELPFGTMAKVGPL